MNGRRARRARQERRAVEQKRKPRGDWKLIGGIAGGIALVAAVAIGLLLARGNGPASPTPASSASDRPAAPDLRGTDPITGREVSLASFRGKPVVLNVWASWCTGCREEARDLARFARDHPEAQLVGVDTQDNSSAARGFYSLYGWTHPSIADPNGSMAAKLALQGLPSTYFIDSKGQIASKIVGASNYAGFSAGLRAAEQA
jgi:thiol-disulfide isomerase/thioredoxin